MFLNFDLDSGLSVFILDFSDKKIVSFKTYNVTRKFYEYSDYTPTLSSFRKIKTKNKNPTYLSIFFRSIIWESENFFCMALLEIRIFKSADATSVSASLSASTSLSASVSASVSAY